MYKHYDKKHTCKCSPRKDIRDAFLPDRACRYGNCVEFYCPDCGATLAGWGPVGCKCEGYIRELFYPEMQARGHHVAVKPSVMRRRNRKRVAKRERF